MIAIDIGNSSIKTGVFIHGKLLAVFISSSVDEAARHIIQTGESVLCISSVRPAAAERLLSLFPGTPNVKMLSAGSPFNFQIVYKNPAALGIDRLCGVAGALHLLGCSHTGAVMTVDLGTATTINFLNERKQFLGGMILPGLVTMAGSLSAAAAQLSDAALFPDAELIGDDTESCIRRGILHSTAAIIEKAYLFFSGRCGTAVKLFVTGGNAEKIVPVISLQFTYERNLNLYGIHSVGT